MADFSVYPNAIDGYAQLPLTVDNVTRVDAVTVNRLRSAIVNIENELGVLPSSLNYETVRARLDALESLISSISLDGFAYKNPVRVASDSNINFSGGAPNQLDNVSLDLNDRILLFGQTNQSENGIYEITDLGTGANGTWVRSSDANSEDKLLPGSEVFVMEGDNYSLCKFWLVTSGPYILETTSLEFVGGLSIMKGDTSPTTILVSTAIGAGESNATPTDSISVRGFKEIDFSFLVTSLDSITDLRARILYSLKESPSSYATTPSDWNILLAENIVDGISTIDPYTLSLDTTAYPDFSSLPASFGFRSPIAGLHMMVLIWSETGASATSDFVGSALRRV